MEPLNNVTFGRFPFFGGYKCEESDVLGQGILFIIERFPLFGLSLNGVSTVIISNRCINMLLPVKLVEEKELHIRTCTYNKILIPTQKGTTYLKR